MERLKHLRQQIRVLLYISLLDECAVSVNTTSLLSVVEKDIFMQM